VVKRKVEQSSAEIAEARAATLKAMKGAEQDWQKATNWALIADRVIPLHCETREGAARGAWRSVCPRSPSLPGYMPPRESVATKPRLAERYPLNVISPKSHGFLNSCYANEPHKIKGQGEQFVMISQKDAAARSIREGGVVEIKRLVAAGACMRLAEGL
jgi:anaerobic selenocysteine-containing dehydrogenase